MPDHPVLLRELRLLERSPARLRREQVTHPRGCHDDLPTSPAACCAVWPRYLGAGAYAEALTRAIADDDVPDPVLALQEQQRQRRHDELHGALRPAGI